MIHGTAAKRPLTDDESWIVAHNLPLVDTCLRGRHRDDALYHDLRQAGYLGLCRAVKLYDPEIAAFSTYACRWIRSFIQRELHDRAMIAVPEYQRLRYHTGSAPTGKARYGHRAAAAMAGYQVGFDVHEVGRVLAVMPPGDPDVEQQRRIATYLDRLPATHREVVRRVVMENEHPCDVARDLGMTAHQVVGVNKFAKRMLRNMMREKIA